MGKILSFALALTTLIALPVVASAADVDANGTNADRPIYADWHDGLILQSSGNSNSFKGSAAADTFCIYGGPGSLLGKFQEANGVTVDDQGWFGVDPTDQPTLWQRSQFNMSNLNNNGAGNHGMWAGQTAAQAPTYASAGYGNNWNAILEYRATVSNPAAGQTVGLDFFFNYENETGFDFLIVEYDSAGAPRQTYAVAGTNKVGGLGGTFNPPGRQYSNVASTAIMYDANAYSGDNNDEIVIRFRATSDGAWSDEDGLAPTEAGHSQVDDITVTHSDGVDFENFEGAGPYLWVPEKAAFAGFFGKFFPLVTDLDPCRDSISPVMGFVDDGTPPSNPAYVGPGTGGTTSTNWSYGIPGGWVTNYNGGVSAGSVSAQNEFWSPPVEWDLASTTGDDDPEFSGFGYSISAYEHLPLTDGMFWQWDVRGTTDNGASWSTWSNRNLVYFSGTPRWVNNVGPVSDLIPVGPTHVQMRILWLDLASLFNFAGNDATPSPFLDNIIMRKFRVNGPIFASRTIDLFNDGFATNGATNLSDQSNRDQHDIRIDMARDVNSGIVLNEPGDSIIVDVRSVIPGVAISDSLNQIQIHYSLNMNPVFEAAIRGNAPVTDPNAGMFGWDQSEGSFAANQSTVSTGIPIADRYFFDLPDEDFLYPGDILEYYIEAEDDDGRTTTFPANIAGYDDPSAAYNRSFIVRGLPTYTDTSGNVPDILVVNDFGRRGGENDYLQALNQNGLTEGIHYDTYTVMGPSSNISNGIGSSGAHGATADQLAGYSCILYFNGDLSANSLSDGSNTGSNDKGDDLTTLTGWFNADADRAIAHFGDYIGTSIAGGSAAGSTYSQSVMGILVNDNDVRDEIDNQTAPRVIPTGAVGGFTTEFTAYGGCLAINRFDSIQAGAGALSSHGFEVAGNQGTTYAGNSAGVAFAQTDGNGNDKRSLTFPYGFVYVWNDQSKVAPGNASARSDLLAEILAYFGGAHQPNPGAATPVDAPKPKLSVAGNYPNPFNPSSTIKYAIGVRGKVSINIYNTRGELVKTLVNQVMDAGDHQATWNGLDRRGTPVSSGVYLYRVEANDKVITNKMVMVK